MTYLLFPSFTVSLNFHFSNNLFFLSQCREGTFSTPPILQQTAQNKIVTLLIFNYLKAEPCSVRRYPNGSDKISPCRLWRSGEGVGVGCSPVGTVSDSISLQNKHFGGNCPLYWLLLSSSLEMLTRLLRECAPYYSLLTADALEEGLDVSL